jgi:hypothetical protein
MERARITPPDVVFLSVSLAVLAFLAEPYYTLLSDAGFGGGAGLIFQMVPAGIVMTILIVTYALAFGGS